MQNDIKNLVKILLDGQPIITVNNSRFLFKYINYSISHPSTLKTLHLKYFINKKEYSFTISEAQLNNEQWECKTEELDEVIIIKMYVLILVSTMDEIVELQYPLTLNEAKEKMLKGYVVENEHGFTYFYCNDKFVTDNKELPFDELSDKDLNRRYRIAEEQASVISQIKT